MRYFRSMIKEFFDMSYITITTEKNETYSSISNFFIDYYMTSASGEFVKVYLYLGSDLCLPVNPCLSPT